MSSTIDTAKLHQIKTDLPGDTAKIVAAIQAVRASLTDTRTRLSTAETSIAATATSVSTLEIDVATALGTNSTQNTRLDTLENNVAAVETRASNIESDVTALTGDVNSLVALVGSDPSATQTLLARVNALNTALADAEESQEILDAIANLTGSQSTKDGLQDNRLAQLESDYAVVAVSATNAASDASTALSTANSTASSFAALQTTVTDLGTRVDSAIDAINDLINTLAGESSEVDGSTFA